MNRRYFLPLTFVLVPLSILVGLFLFWPSKAPVYSSDGGPEMASQRLQWEWERLRNPQTGKIPEDIQRRERTFSAMLPTRSANAIFMKSAGIAEYDWQPRGPWNVGGRTRAMAMDVNNENIILAGGVSGGMWRSTDAGLTWQRVTRPDQNPSVTCIVQDIRPGKTNTWYCGSGELYGNSASGGGAFFHGDGLFKSTDNGRTWFSLTSTASGTPQQFNVRDNAWRLAMDYSNTEEDEVYAAIYGRIIRSSDGGETWTEVVRPGFGQSSSYFTDVAITSSGVVYATFSSEGGVRGILRSNDGISYTNISPDDMPGRYNRIVIGIAPSDENIVYFLGETPGSGFLGQNFRGDSSWHTLWKYTYLSGNGAADGGTWENRSANLPSFTTETAGNGDLYSQGGYDLHIRVKPDDKDVVFIGGTNLYRSTDGFVTDQNTAWIGGFRDWQRDSGVVEYYSYPNHHADQHDVVFSRTNPNVMISVSDGGLHKTVNCLADSIDWISLNSGYVTSQFYTIAIDHGTTGDQTVMGGLQDNGTWRTTSGDKTVPWSRTGSSDGAYCAISDGGRNLYVSKQLGRVYRVELDENGNEVGSTRIDPEGAHDYRFINPFVLDPNDSKIMYLPIGPIISVNGDVTAIPLGNKGTATIGWDSLVGSAIDTGTISAITASTANPANRLWYGTSFGRVYRLDNPLGVDPVAVEVTSDVFPLGGFVSCVTVDPENGDRAIVAFSNYEVVSLFETTDAGETWHSVSGNLEENPDGRGAGPSVRWISILHRGGGTIYLAGTSTGLYSTLRLDGDETVWAREASETLGNGIVDMIDVRQSDGFVAVATHGNGVWSTTVGLLGVETPEVPGSGLVLEQSYPNPMRGHTTLSFTLPEGGALPVELTLYDTEGRQIATVMQETLFPGRHSVRISREVVPGQRLASGTYFYRLKAGETMKSRAIHVE